MIVTKVLRPDKSVKPTELFHKKLCLHTFAAFNCIIVTARTVLVI